MEAEILNVFIHLVVFWMQFATLSCFGCNFQHGMPVTTVIVFLSVDCIFRN